MSSAPRCFGACARHTGRACHRVLPYAETVNALRLLLARDPGVAALTANGARVAGGRVSRETVLSQFTPPRDGSRAANRAEQLEALSATDLFEAEEATTSRRRR